MFGRFFERRRNPSPTRGRGFKGKGEGSSSSKKARTEEGRGKGKGGRTAAEYSTDEEDDYFVEKEVKEESTPSYPYVEYTAPEGCLLVRDPNNHREVRFRMAELPWENSEDEREAQDDAWEDIVAETDALTEKSYGNWRTSKKDEADEVGPDKADEAHEVGSDRPHLPPFPCDCGDRFCFGADDPLPCFLYAGRRNPLFLRDSDPKPRWEDEMDHATKLRLMVDEFLRLSIKKVYEGSWEGEWLSAYFGCYGVEYEERDTVSS